MLLKLREYISDELVSDQKINFDSEKLTIGRANYADVQIGQNFHPTVQRAISRIQASLERDEEEQIAIRDGDDQPSSSGVYFRGKRIKDFLIIEQNQPPVVLFEWHKTIEKIQGWSSVRIELSLLESNIKEPVTGSNDWKKLSAQVEDGSAKIEFLTEAVEALKQQFTGVEERVQKQFDTLVTPQLAEIRDRLSIQSELDRQHSIDIARIVRQIRMVGITIAFVLGSSILLSGIKGAKDNSQNSWLDIIRAGIPIVAVAIVAGKLSSKKRG